jgi:uncharacterized membrane protein YdbT with pleckstrin-like domain
VADITPKLLSGEQVVFKTDKHWLSPLSDSKWAILMILGSLVVAWLQTDATSGFMGFVNRVLDLLRLGLFFGGVGWIVYNIIAWRTAHYAVTNKRVIAHEGLLRSRDTDTLLTSVTDVRSKVPALGRMLGFGTVQILSSSGESGADTFTSVRKVEEFKHELLEQKSSAPVITAPVAAAAASVPAASAPAASAAAPASSSDAMATLAGLAQLRDSGAITAAEYDAKKQEVMARI